MPDANCPGGGITKVEKDFKPGLRNGGVMLYLYVNGLEGWEEVSWTRRTIEMERLTDELNRKLQRPVGKQ